MSRRRSFVLHLRALAKGIGIALLLVVMLWGQGTRVLAEGASPSCPRGMSQIDCDAITFGWVDWAPYTGCATTTAYSLPNTTPPAYAVLLNAAAAHANASVTLLAAIFLTENGNTWRTFPLDDPTADASWATSNTGAEGPFQFEPGTWSEYRTDGNGDGKTDVANMWDAAFSAATMIAAGGAAPNTPLNTSTLQITDGKVDNSSSIIQKHTLLWVAAAYNAGEGAVEEAGGRVANLPEQTIEYIDNVYALINSGFKDGNHPGYPSPPEDDTKGAAITKLPPNVSGSNTQAISSIDNNTSCSGNSSNHTVAGAAIDLSWPEQFQDALSEGIAGSLCKKRLADCEDRSSPLTPTKAYTAALQQVFPDVLSSSILSYGADCGVFVSTVMHFSGTDKNYPESSTITQGEYVKKHPEIYTIVTSISSTADLHPGDILLLPIGRGGQSGHTLIYTGTNGGKTKLGYDSASASQGSRMPNMGSIAWSIEGGLNDPISSGDRGPYFIARPKETAVAT